MYKIIYHDSAELRTLQLASLSEIGAQQVLCIEVIDHLYSLFGCIHQFKKIKVILGLIFRSSS